MFNKTENIIIQQALFGTTGARAGSALRGSHRYWEVLNDVERFSQMHTQHLFCFESVQCAPTYAHAHNTHNRHNIHSFWRFSAYINCIYIIHVYNIHYFGMILTSGWMCLMKSSAVHEPGLWVVLRHPCYHSCWRFQKRGGLLSVAPSLIIDHAAVNQGPASPGPSRLMLAWRAFLSIRMTYYCSVIYAVRRDRSISDHLARNGVINVRQESHWAVKFTGHQKMGRVGGSGGDVCNK